jgi:hypothetical protein
MELEGSIFPTLPKEKLIEWMDYNLEEIRGKITESLIREIQFHYEVDPEDPTHRTIVIDFWKHDEECKE